MRVIRFILEHVEIKCVEINAGNAIDEIIKVEGLDIEKALKSA